METTTNNLPRIPIAPKAIQKGVPLKDLLGLEAIDHLAQNILLVHPQFAATSFQEMAWNGLESLGIMERGQHLAKTLRQHLPQNYSTAIKIIVPTICDRFLIWRTKKFLKSGKANRYCSPSRL